ncbi:MAG: hypothetical protein KDD51_05355 [Bdellovibrionales bacterium]|nr:hypothetical protein [Bdellovibrionales bacterium]
MKFALAVIGATLLFFFGSSASADSNSDQINPAETVVTRSTAYAVYCDAGVDRSAYKDEMIERSESGDDVMVLTSSGYHRLMQTLSNAYEQHCGPGVRVSIKKGGVL